MDETVGLRSRRRLLDRLGLWATLVALATGIAFLGRFHWLPDLATHFRALYLAAGLCLVPVFAVSKNWRWLAVSMAIVAVNAPLVLPLYVPSGRISSAGASTITVMEANVLTINREHEKLEALVTEVDPDVLVLIEVNHAWLDGLRELKEHYPYSIEEPRSDNFGLAILSKVPFNETGVRDLADVGVPSLMARLEVGSAQFSLLAVHTVPPGGGTMSSLRNRQLEALAQEVSKTDGLWVVTGDLNVTPWNSHFQSMLRSSGLVDARKGHGTQPTWPAMFWPIAIPIDHCLISPGIEVEEFRILRRVGSDHLPLLVTLSLPNRNAE